MRLVLDTNTVVSGLLWHGPPGELIDAAQAHQVLLFTSVALLTELQGVLHRDKFRRQFELRDLSIRDIFDGYAALASLLTPVAIGTTGLRDPDDDAVLACAVAGHAELIVSGDADLLEVGEYEGIRIVNAATALRLIAASTGRDNI